MAPLLYIVVSNALDVGIASLSPEQVRAKATAIWIGLLQPFSGQQVAEEILGRIFGIPTWKATPPGKGIGRFPITTAQSIQRGSALTT